MKKAPNKGHKDLSQGHGQGKMKEVAIMKSGAYFLLSGILAFTLPQGLMADRFIGGIYCNYTLEERKSSRYVFTKKKKPTFFYTCIAIWKNCGNNSTYCNIGFQK